MIKVLNEHPEDSLEMRAAYCNTLIELAKKDSRIVAITTDLSNSMGTKNFAKELPAQFYDVGIAEQNAAAMACGMSSAGLIPFYHTFSVFATRRVADQVFLSGAYAGQSVKLIGGDAGVTTAVNGGTHMPFEDIGMMRVIPEMTVLEASDAVMMKCLTKWMTEHYGMVYMRMPRRKVAKIYEEGSEFTVGKGVVIRDGADVTIITLGIQVLEAIKAAEMLAAKGIQARVIDMFTVKPIDKELIIESAAKTGCIVTAENHNIIGGLGSAVAEVLVDNKPVPVERVGIKDTFGEVGSIDYLMEKFQLSAPYIAAAAERAIARK